MDPRHSDSRDVDPRHSDSRDVDPRHSDSRDVDPRHSDSRDVDPRHSDSRDVDPRHRGLCLELQYRRIESAQGTRHIPSLESDMAQGDQKLQQNQQRKLNK